MPSDTVVSQLLAPAGSRPRQPGLHLHPAAPELARDVFDTAVVEVLHDKYLTMERRQGTERPRDFVPPLDLGAAVFGSPIGDERQPGAQHGRLAFGLVVAAQTAAGDRTQPRLQRRLASEGGR